MRFKEFELKKSERALLRHGAVVDVGQLGFDLLVFLLENRDRVVSKSELLREVWGGRAISASAIPTAINALRNALGDSASEPELIRTIYGHGYQWIAPLADSDEVPLQLGMYARPTAFVGRRAELASAELLLNDVKSHRPNAVFVVGSAGVGKSWFVDEVARMAERRGFQVATGRCWETPGAPAYRVWRDVLEELDCGDLWSLVSSHSHLADESPENAGAARYELFEGIAKGLEVAAKAKPVLVALDDLHCADLATIQLLDSILREHAPGRVRFMGAFRPLDAYGAARETLAELVQFGGAVSLELEGLTPEESRQLIDVKARFDVDDAVSAALVARTAGNPLFLVELVRQLNEAWEAGFRSDLVREVERVGPSLQRAVERGLARVERDDLFVLQAAAVVGREFDLAAVSVLAGKDEAETLASLSSATRLDVVQASSRSGRYRFGHVLYRDALYEGVSPVRRVEMHRRALEFLRDRHGELSGEVACLAARHSLALPEQEVADQTIGLLQEAASWSEANLGFEEAATYLQDALGVLLRTGASGSGPHVSLLNRLGGAQRRAGDPEAAAKTFSEAAHRARGAGDSERFAEAALGFAPGFFAIEAGVVDEQLIELLNEALKMIGDDGDPALRARLTGRLAMALYWSAEEEARERCASEALDLAARAADPAVTVFATTAREVARWGPAGARARADMAQWAIGPAEESGDREMELVYRLYRMTSLLQIGEFDGVWKELDVFSRRAAASLHRSGLWYRDLLNALRAMMMGDWAEAESCAESFVDLGRSLKDRNAENCAVIHEAYRNIEYGSEETARSLVDDQATRFPRVRSYECGRVYLAAACGFEVEARRRLSRLVSKERLELPKTVEWLIGAALLSEACAILGDRERAKVLYEALREYEDEFVVVVFSVAVWRPVSYFLARLATTIQEYEDAERLFDKARSQSEDLGARPWLGHVLLGHAQLLRRRAWPGDGLKARELGLQAEEVATSLEMKPLIKRARAFLWGPTRRHGTA